MLSLPGMGVLGSILIVLVAFSALIFVHEFGHYIACRMIGVRVERFFIGFDAWGLGLKREINGTVYGIGVIPLGGYVKPAGQADDPRQQKLTGAPDELPSQPLWAQAIMFSAGVLMNFLFGYVLLVFGYLHGIPFSPPILGRLVEKGQAETHKLRPGDRILSINAVKVNTFEQISSTIFDFSEEELTVRVEREEPDGSKRVLERKIKAVPNEGARGRIPYIGAAPAETRVIGEIDRQPEFAALRSVLQVGDSILAINGERIGKYQGHRVQEIVDKYPGEVISVLRQRGQEPQETVKVRVQAYGVYDLGLRFQVGIGRVYKHTPAAEAGLKAGDIVCGIEEHGKTIYLRDASDFSDRIAAHALNPVDLTVVRGGATQTVAAFKPNPMPGDPRIASGKDTLLGVKVEAEEDGLGFRIVQVFPEGPGQGKLMVGDRLRALDGKPLTTSLGLGVQVDRASSREVAILVKRQGKGKPVTLRLRPRIHPDMGRPLIGVTQGTLYTVTAILDGPFKGPEWRDSLHVGSRILALTLSPDLKTTRIEYMDPKTKKRSGRILDTPSRIIHSLQARLDAGLKGRLPIAMKPAREVVAADGLGDAMRIAAEKWVDMAVMIYTVLERLVTRTIPLEAVGGPVLLFRSIHVASEIGFGMVIYLVALISVNLGVINLLPFPVLDGGHLMFLLIEWVKGSPPSERIREYAQYVGIVCILTLMLTVTWYDLRHWLF